MHFNLSFLLHVAAEAGDPCMVLSPTSQYRPAIGNHSRLWALCRNGLPLDERGGSQSLPERPKTFAQFKEAASDCECNCPGFVLNCNYTNIPQLSDIVEGLVYREALCHIFNIMTSLACLIKQYIRDPSYMVTFQL